ncbi:MAG TPA: hypothetical protein VG890_14900 [Puia sp.]|nr:hypothetical protein [Puia sp.]
MTLLDVSFGIFAFLPQGWLFMAFVIILECLTMTRILLPRWFDKGIYRITALTNIISGLTGIIISMILNGGWYLVVWFPWVSSNEINLTKKEALHALIIFYAAAFILTLIIEIITNILFLRKHYLTKQIVKATIIANILSYAVGTIVLYSYSFH